MAIVTDEITSLKNYTTALLAKTDTLTGVASANLTQSDFMRLLTQQLQYQDPMEPKDNSEFVTQLCQFSQLNLTTDISTSLSKFTAEQKASSLVGEKVALQDPENPQNTITGVVSSAYLNGPDSGVTVNGMTYPLKYLLYTFGNSSANDSSGGGSST